MESFDPHDREVLGHYERFFGEVHHIYEFADMPEPAPSPVFVAEFAPTTTDAEWTYATAGMSRQPMESGESHSEEGHGYRAELILWSTERFAELADSLSMLAAYPFMEHTYFAPGHTIAGEPNEGIVRGSPLTEIFIYYPFPMPPEFEVIDHADGSHTHVLWVNPIYLSERQVVIRHGHERPVDIFSEQEVDIHDLWRPPAV